MIIPKQKIKVFISSACGDDPSKQKYNLVRVGLKALIESTHFAEVYVFESEGASTTSAVQHYTFALEDCDVCIFLIDNKDGIPNGVQVEIDAANKYGIKSLYYFCDQSSKEETPLQRSLKGANHAKSKTVHSFEDFIQSGATDLIDDLVLMYKHYCKGRLAWNEAKTNEKTDNILLSDYSVFSDNVAHKDVLTNIDYCKSYFSQLILGHHPIKEVTNTSAIDKLCVGFLPVIFGGEQVDTNKLEMLKSELEKQQTKSHFSVTQKRLDAINVFYKGDLNGCISILDDALKLAKSELVPSWIINDILIDLRNQERCLEESQNHFLLEGQYQKELNESNSLLYCPLIDRFDSNYYGKLTQNRIKYKIQSPHTITIGHDLDIYTDLLASSYIFAMYNGSLTHLQMLYKRIKVLAFYYAERYSDWNLKTLLLKTSIFDYNTKEIDGITSYFSDILSKMNSSDAYDIYKFADNWPVAYQRFSAKLEAFRITGYFINGDKFALVWAEIFQMITNWIEDSNAPVVIGNHIFAALEGTYLRTDQDQLAEFVYKCLKLHMRRFYDELFKIITRCVNLEELSKESSGRLLGIIIEIVSDENERKSIYSLCSALCSLRKQSRELTDQLDKAIGENMPDFYAGDYRLETTKDESSDMPTFIEEYVNKIVNRNETQGEGGGFSGYADSPYLVIKSTLKQSNIKFAEELIDSAFIASYDTLMRKRQTINAKMESIELIVFLLKTFPDILVRNSHLISGILENKAVIETGSAIMTNLNEAHLRLFTLLLYSCLGEDISTDLIEILTDIGDEALSQIKASQAFKLYLDLDNADLDRKIESIILQHAIKWCTFSNLEVRWNAVKILFALLKNPGNKNIVCKQFIRLIDSDNVYIKNTILRMLSKINEIDSATYDYVLQKAALDNNYVVRKIAEEVRCKK